MAFDDDIALSTTGDGAIADGWATPRGPHGGYVMALVARAMEQAVDDPARQPRSLTCHFLRPPKVGPVQLFRDKYSSVSSSTSSAEGTGNS